MLHLKFICFSGNRTIKYNVWFVDLQNLLSIAKKKNLKLLICDQIYANNNKVYFSNAHK